MAHRITINAYPATSSTELRPGKRATEFAADSLLVDAVSSEPVSGLNSLVTGRFTGNFAPQEPPAPMKPRRSACQSAPSRHSEVAPCKIEQGILEQVSGNYLGAIKEFIARSPVAGSQRICCSAGVRSAGSLGAMIARQLDRPSNEVFAPYPSRAWSWRARLPLRFAERCLARSLAVSASAAWSRSAVS